MGVYTNLLARATMHEAASPRSATRHIYEWLERVKDRRDPAVGSAYTAADAVVTIATYTGTPTSGNFTLTITLPNNSVTALGQTIAAITTANIAHNANAATIEGAIDTAITAAGTVSGWTNADISVAAGGTTFLDGNMVFTFDGDSVKEQEATVAINDVNLDTGTVGAVVQTTAGQGTRNATQALFDLSIVSGTVPAQGTAPSDWTKNTARLEKLPRPKVIQALALEAAIEDNTVGTYTAVADLYTLPSMGFTGA
jgi:hypothetical protein